MMNIAEVFLPSIARLSDYVRRQHNCTFNFQDAEDLQSELELNPLLEARLHNESIVVDGDWVCFPIFSVVAAPETQKLIGVARISRSEQLSSDDLAGLEKIIRSVFENRLTGAELLHNLTTTETNLRSLENEPQPDKNIIHLRRHQQNPYPLPNRNTDKNATRGTLSALNFPFLIQSMSSEDIFKMALEIHSQSQRYAFIMLTDLDPTTLESLENINKLGEVTIFIPNIALLTISQQFQIESYYSSPRNKLSPQFIGGTIMPIGELKKSCKVSATLLSQLMIGYLCLTQPFSSYKRENMLEFFFDSLSGRTYQE